MDVAELEMESAELLPDRQALCCWNYGWHSGSWNSWHSWNAWHGCNSGHAWEQSWNSWQPCGWQPCS